MKASDFDRVSRLVQRREDTRRRLNLLSGNDANGEPLALLVDDGKGYTPLRISIRTSSDEYRIFDDDDLFQTSLTRAAGVATGERIAHQLREWVLLELTNLDAALAQLGVDLDE